MNDKRPTVSIGLPVYNGENFLSEAIESILNQTYSDFELIISNNGSTDKTEEICNYYGSKDKRVRLFQNKENRGAAWNFNRVFELSTGEYFKWVAHDDICAPKFVEKCVEALYERPSFVLAYPRTLQIDDEGRFLREKNYILDGDSPKSYKRFRRQISLSHWCFHVFGLIRANALKQTSLIGAYVGSDRVLLAKLALLGKFYEVPEDLYFHREHKLRSTRAFRTMQGRAEWFDPAKKGRLILPFWRMFSEYLLILGKTSLTAHERIMCSLELMRCFKRYRRYLLNDLLYAIHHI